MRRHINEMRKTRLANTGRIAGDGIIEDRYDDDEWQYGGYHHQSKFNHKPGGHDGEVIVMKASDVLQKQQ